MSDRHIGLLREAARIARRRLDGAARHPPGNAAAGRKRAALQDTADRTAARLEAALRRRVGRTR